MKTERRNPLTTIFAKHFTRATVTDVEPVTPAVRRIRLVADEPLAPSYTPGQHVRIQINDPLSLRGLLQPGDTLRTYTIWDYAPRERAIELRAHLYGGDGIGLRWVESVRPGEPVTFWGPQGDFATRDADFHLFVGEETAACAFGPMIRALGEEARVYGVLESDRPGEELPLDGPHDLRRVHRHGASAVASPVLLAGLAALELPGNTGAAYVAGEARTCQLVRNYLVRERNWPRTSIKVKPFWAPGKRGLHH
ncbi:siderophore-interacting protein [Nonomuraea sp. NPDC048826]|uniref:siderophore-interacting protein n=1 Tax=Nonomuraea sp. NPDC048826 TaxID=3364347 RepID=UPI00371F84CF